MADNDGKLYIIITDQPVVNSTQTITENTTTETPQKNKQIKTTQSEDFSVVYSFAVHQFYDLITQTGTEIVNWSISNIGNFTGNYIKQANVQQTVSLGNKLLGIGSAVFAGAKIGSAGGPMGSLIGALVAGTVAVVGTGVNIALENKANEFQVQKQNREIAQLKELSGLNSLTNGGRI